VVPTDPPRVLVLSPGAKAGLVRHLAEAVARRAGTLVAWETDLLSPAALHCSERVDGGPIEDATATERLLHWCSTRKIRLIVPTRHGDLPALASARERFSAAGIEIAVSSPACIGLCLDKSAAHRWLSGQGFPVPAQCTVRDLAASLLREGFPLVAKDPAGSGSRGLRICRAPSDMDGLPDDWIVQSHAPGREFTVNVYVDRTGRSLCEIPHERLLVSEGEVVRGRTAKIPALVDLARRIAEALPGARGPLNIQAFWDAAASRATVIEINPRFGGGYPLAHRAGGRFTDWLLAEHCDARPLPRADDWEDGLGMVRFREAAFFPARDPAPHS
jgi:carbamoyl-phosphate synthase large subunit